MMNLLDTIRHDLRKESGKGGNDLDLSTSTLFKDGMENGVTDEAIALAAMHRSSSVLEDFKQVKAKKNLQKSKQQAFFSKPHVGKITDEYINSSSTIYRAEGVPVNDTNVLKAFQRNYIAEKGAINNCRCAEWDETIGDMGFLLVEGVTYPAVVIPDLFKANQSTEKDQILCYLPSVKGFTRKCNKAEFKPWGEGVVLPGRLFNLIINGKRIPPSQLEDLEKYVLVKNLWLVYHCFPTKETLRNLKAKKQEAIWSNIFGGPHKNESYNKFTSDDQGDDSSNPSDGDDDNDTCTGKSQSVN
eukprot:scaffold40737_cov42-Cyclotella_meneghiniana.AAC.1